MGENESQGLGMGKKRQATYEDGPTIGAKHGVVLRQVDVRKGVLRVFHRCGDGLGEEDRGYRKASVYNVQETASSGSWRRGDFGVLLKTCLLPS